MLRATLKGFLAHKFRLALTTLAVVLGVAFVAGTYVLTDTMNSTFDNLFADASRGVDVYVRSEAPFEGGDLGGRERVPASLLETVAAVDGVAFAEGEVTGYAQLVDKQGEAISPQAPTLGVSWPEQEAISALTVREGRRPEAAGEVAVDAATAERYGFGVGDRVQILFEGPAAEFTIIGIAGFGEADNLAGATLAAFDLRTAQDVLGAGEAFDAIDVVAGPGITSRELRDRIASVLPRGVEAATGDTVAAEQSDSIKDQLSFFNTALLVFAAVALFVGAFIIFNTFNILVTQRTRELGLMRALGARGSQVMRSVIAEALLVGVIASAVGLGAGILLAIGLEALLAAFGLDIPSSGLAVMPRTVVVSFVVGIVVTLAASILPARRAARIAPIAALREGSSVRPVALGRRSVAGAAVAAVGTAALLVGLFADVTSGVQLVGLGVALTFLGVAILSPVLAKPLARAIGAPLVRVAALPGKLGRENAMRNSRRTASTSSALMVGLGLVGTFLIIGASIRATIVDAIERTFRADYVLTSTTGMMGGFTPMIAEHLREMPDLATVSQVRIGQWREQGTEGTRFLSALDPATIGDVLELDVQEGDLEALSGDAVLVQERTAADEGLEIGDTLNMEFAATSFVPATVVGIFAEQSLVSSYVIPLEMYERSFTEQLDQRVFVNAGPGLTPAEARRGIEGMMQAFPNVRVQDQAELRKEQEDLTNQILGLVTALLGLAIVIALLGIVNTLALSVLERTRELGLLRAVGLSRRQLRSMIRWESVIIALIGGVIGLVVGTFFGWALVRALADEGIDRFAVPSVQLVVFLVLAGLAGVFAAILPARRAAKLDVLRAIAYE